MHCNRRSRRGARPLEWENVREQQWCEQVWWVSTWANLSRNVWKPVLRKVKGSAWSLKLYWTWIIAGFLAAGVPGELAGYWEIFRRFGSGRVEWKQLVQPTIEWAIIFLDTRCYHSDKTVYQKSYFYIEFIVWFCCFCNWWAREKGQKLDQASAKPNIQANTSQTI